MDSLSESRSAVDGGSLRSVAQGSARSLPVPQEPSSVAVYQVRASVTPMSRPEELESGRRRGHPQPLGAQYAVFHYGTGN